MKRVLAIALSAAMLVSMMAGCSSNKNSTETSTNTTEQTTEAPETTEEDPLLAIREAANVGANVDSPTFQEDLAELASFWTQYFVFGDPLNPADQDTNKDQANIGWRGNYYINGLSKTILDNNPWLGQTVGWGDQNGADGTVTFQDSDNITVE